MKKNIIVFILICSLTFYFVALSQTSQSDLKASVARGKKLYAQYCLTCHQADGSGVPNINPPLIQTSYVLGDKTKLIEWVLQGSKTKVPIDDKYYSNNMPPQNYLKDQQIADILTYIRNSFGNKASGVLLAEVKTARAATK